MGQLCTCPFVSELLPEIVWLIHTDDVNPNDSFISQRMGASFAKHNDHEKELMKGTYLLAKHFLYSTKDRMHLGEARHLDGE